MPWLDIGGYHEQLQRDAPFLCSDQRMDTELVDRLVLQLNRIYPQILSDKEAPRVTTDYIYHQQCREQHYKLNPLPGGYCPGVCAEIQFNMRLSAVQEAERVDKGPVSGAAEAPAWKRRGGVSRILQRPSHPRWGHLLQPAQQSQRKRYKHSTASQAR